MTGELVIRRGTRQDAKALRRFRCATGPWYEAEAERFIRRGLSRRVGRSATVWVAERDGRLVAVGAHEPHAAPDHPDAPITYLSVLASSRDLEGTLVTASVLGQLLKALMADVVATGRVPFLYTLVAADNDKMRAFCERGGYLSRPVPSKPKYLYYGIRLTEPDPAAVAAS